MTWPAALSGVNALSTSGNVSPGDRPQFDGDHVVEYPPPVREPGQIPADHPEDVRVRGRVMAMFSRSMSACSGPVLFWKPGTIPAGYR